ncbi:hypothetical protein BS50DRAFT_631838 [Corynespora cassiicola Philippines]|uniref:Uncharacterized protein n=1 Tax=Corynespora cassiicola Philippines TaxID=1448308 RepID=A0A2T2NXQ6_CORCC|nr:hypothetical protein BS50DRAFT_631838 [Corynespora cassiicola Philippines]
MDRADTPKDTVSQSMLDPLNPRTDLERFTLAEHCRHTLHPGTPQTLWICPSCKVDQLLEDLKRLEKAWNANGGPTSALAKNANLHWKIAKAWVPFKRELVSYTTYLETWAERELVWEVNNPGRADEAGLDIKSSSAALRFARTNTPYLELLDSDSEIKKSASVTKISKKVKFEEDILDAPSRKLELFKRTSPLYSPGRWASSEEDSIDDSFAIDRGARIF